MADSISKITGAMPGPDAVEYVTRQGDNMSSGRNMSDIAYCPSDSPFNESYTDDGDDD